MDEILFFKLPNGRFPSIVVLASGAFVSVTLVFLYRIKKNGTYIHLGLQSDLPIGLPNPRNVCYFNALIQAMAANASLVRLLKRSARFGHNKFLYRLLCLLKGLRCSSAYIAKNNLGEVLRKNHELLIHEIAHTHKWSAHEQQDAHELFGFIMDQTYCQKSHGAEYTSSRKLSALFNFSLPCYQRIVIGRSYCSASETVKFQSVLCDSFPLKAFQRNLIASQVTCKKCQYHSDVIIQPEACLTIFLEPPTNNKLSKEGEKLPISETSSHQSSLTLSDYLLSQYATFEPLPDMRCPNCPVSSSTSTPTDEVCERGQWITNVPNYLVIYVQRSGWHNISGFQMPNIHGNWSNYNFDEPSHTTARIGTKRSDRLNFPNYIDMAEYLLSSRRPGSKVSASTLNYGDHKDDHIYNGRMNSSDPQIIQHKPYVLRSLVVHQGSYLQSGHYISYRKWPIHYDIEGRQKPNWLNRLLSNTFTIISNFFSGLPTQLMNSSCASSWLMTSDTLVLRVSEAEVRSSLAYLLFYERVSSESSELDCSNELSLNDQGTDILSRLTDDEYLSEDEVESDGLEDLHGHKVPKVNVINGYALAASNLRNVI